MYASLDGAARRPAIAREQTFPSPDLARFISWITAADSSAGGTAGQVHAKAALSHARFFKPSSRWMPRFSMPTNHRDLEKFGSLLADDTGVLSRQGLAEGKLWLRVGRTRFVAKVTSELIPGTLEVYPIANYGAVEIGAHRFHHPGHDDDVGEAKFIHLWQKKMECGRSLG